MRYKTVRVFFINQHEKEEKWLNEMAAKGFAMASIRGGISYEFLKCEPGEYTYRLELLEHNVMSPESINYIQFIEDTGAEMVGSWARWVYFRKKASVGEFDLFSDLDSKVNHYIRIRNFLLPFMFLEFSIAALNFSGYLSNAYQYDWAAESMSSINLFYSILTGFLGVIMLLFFLSIQKKVKALKIEQRIRE